jgi:hypothetical protein
VPQVRNAAILANPTGRAYCRGYVELRPVTEEAH